MVLNSITCEKVSVNKTIDIPTCHYLFRQHLKDRYSFGLLHRLLGYTKIKNNQINKQALAILNWCNIKIAMSM